MRAPAGVSQHDLVSPGLHASVLASPAADPAAPFPPSPPLVVPPVEEPPVSPRLGGALTVQAESRSKSPTAKAANRKARTREDCSMGAFLRALRRSARNSINPPVSLFAQRKMTKLRRADDEAPSATVSSVSRPSSVRLAQPVAPSRCANAGSLSRKAHECDRAVTEEDLQPSRQRASFSSPAASSARASLTAKPVGYAVRYR